jgi:hypothetical protein
MILNQKYSYTGSDVFDVSQIQFNESGVALFNTQTGFGGIDYIPNDGDTVAIIASNSTGAKQQKYRFVPSMNNKVYYLVSNQVFTSNDRALMISAATEITVTFVVDRYEGTFTYHNPLGLEYLYLIWDYADNLDAGDITFDGGGDGTVRFIDIDYGTKIGSAGVNIETLSGVARYVLSYDGTNILDTGYIGENSMGNYDELISLGIAPEDIKLQEPYDGTVNNGDVLPFLFKKYLVDGRAQLVVYMPLSNTEIEAQKIPVYTTEFFIDLADGDLSNVCSQIPNVAVYHNGSNLLPIAGDTIFIDPSGEEVYSPTPSSLHLISETSLIVPPVSGGVFISALPNGIVDSQGGCDCDEIAVPDITQGDIQVVIGSFVDIRVQADNNPTSWEIVTDCDEYLLEGGQSGSYFTYTQCDGCDGKILVNYNTTARVCSSTVPTLVTGDGSVKLTGVCQDSSIIGGLLFNTVTGSIEGTPVEGGTKEITLKATNCFGTSIEYSFTVTSVPAMTMKPFLIDRTNFQIDGATACTVSTPELVIMYHSGCGELPDLGDVVFLDGRGLETFTGGNRYYNVSPSTYSYQINQFGQVIDKYTC